MRKRKTVGWCLVLVALILMGIGESIASMMSLLPTLGAMLVGGVGVFLIADDQS